MAFPGEVFLQDRVFENKSVYYTLTFAVEVSMSSLYIQ